MKVLVTRPADKAAALRALLETAGLEPVCLPAIETLPVEDMAALDRALAWLAEYRWIVFTSGTAARLFCQRAQALKISLGGAGAHVVAGPTTAEILGGYDVRAATVISPFSAERALDLLAPLVCAGDRVLL